MSLHPSTENLDTVESLIAEAIKIERERCAKIVQSYEWIKAGEYNDSDDPRPEMARLIREGRVDENIPNNQRSQVYPGRHNH